VEVTKRHILNILLLQAVAVLLGGMVLVHMVAVLVLAVCVAQLLQLVVVELLKQE
jgi:hypothetical protein